MTPRRSRRSSRPGTLLLVLGAWKVTAAISEGNTAVLETSEQSHLGAFLLGEITATDDLVTGSSYLGQGVGQDVRVALVSDPQVRPISFTASVSTTSLIAAQAARTLTPVSCELGVSRLL